MVIGAALLRSHAENDNYMTAAVFSLEDEYSDFSYQCICLSAVWVMRAQNFTARIKTFGGCINQMFIARK